MKNIIMKHFVHFIELVIILLVAGCAKETSHSVLINNYNPQKDSLIQFLKKEIPNDILKLDLATITKITYQNKILAFQIFERSSSQKFLLLRKDSNSYVGNWVDLSGLMKSQNEGYSGRILLENFDRQSSTKLNIENNRLIRSEKSGNALSRFIKVLPNQENTFSSRPRNIAREGGYVILPEIVVYMSDREVYYNLNSLFEGHGYYNNCFTVAENNERGGGGGSNSSQNNQDKEVIVLPVFTGPKNPIKNIKEELKCFTISASSTYSISVRVNQPRPTTSDKFNPSVDFMVGHTYLSLEQINADGSKIVRNVGFYPKGFVYPGSSDDVSVFGEDSQTPFAVSLTMAVSGTELTTVINTLLNQQSKPYELNNFNCVNSSASALESIGVHLPLSSSGIKNLFKGYSPGEFGQDIRNLDLESFSSKSGNRTMSIQVKDKNELKPSPRAGKCQ